MEEDMSETINSQQWSDLLNQAIAAREKSYSPYSHYKVGAALLGRSGKVYTGCNIENAAYTPSICAERTAIFKAISEGEREFVAIAVVTLNGGAPCGICRQVMREFAPNITIIIGNLQGERQLFTLPDLLPHSFGPDSIVSE
jgi:cytidine deaminase